MHTLTIDLDGPWQLYSPVLPARAVALGTVQRAGEATPGALVRLPNGRLVQCTAGIVRVLPELNLKPKGA